MTPPAFVPGGTRCDTRADWLGDGTAARSKRGDPGRSDSAGRGKARGRAGSDRCGQVVLDASQRVLLVRHTYGRYNWEIPGGIGLPGEAPTATARRELLEEVGIDLEGRLTGVYFEPGHDFGAMLHFVFAASLPPDAVPTPSSEEISALDWRRPDDLPAPISDFTERRIRDAIGGSPAALHIVGERRWREG